VGETATPDRDAWARRLPAKRGIVTQPPVPDRSSRRDQCKAAGVPYFNKQLGARVTAGHGVRLLFDDNKGGDPEEWPEDLRVREYPKMEAAR